MAPRAVHIQPETRYARSGDVDIAYQVVGEGQTDLLLIPGWISHLDLQWEEPAIARILGRLASFSRLILMDKRGTGLSDRVRDTHLPTLEQRMEDVHAVLDAVGSERAALLGVSEGGPLAILLAATYPQRTSSLIVYGGYARFSADDDYPWVPTLEEQEATIEPIRESWSSGRGVRAFAPSMAGEQRVHDWWARFKRAAASPNAAVALHRMNIQIDVRPALGVVQAPTLVLHRTDDALIAAENGRYLAERIPGARMVELPGADHWWWAGDSDTLVDEVEEFVTGARGAREPERVLATVLFTDIVGSTERAAALGDRRWRDLLASHDAAVRRELVRFRGREVKTVGDGFVAAFDGPARAIRCASSIRESVARLGIEMRAGVHTGEVELIGDDLGGLAVHIGARVGAQAGPGEILVSGTVKDLVVGSGIEFADRGVQPLKGVPGDWRLFSVES